MPPQPTRTYVADADDDASEPLYSATPPSHVTVAEAEPEGDDRGDGRVPQGEALGQPDQRVDASNSAPAADSTLLAREADREQRLFAELLAAMDPSPPFWARWVGSAGLAWAAVLLGSALALFVAGQVALLVSQLSALPEPARTIGLAGVGVLALAFAAAGLRLTVKYVRFRASPAVRVDALYELAVRQQIRAAYIHRAYEAVYGRLVPILAGYPLDGPDAGRDLKRCGATAGEVEQLTAVRRRLLAAGEAKADWVHEFDRRFLAVLDEVATRRTRRAAMTAGKLTAVSPRGALDAVLVSALAVDLVGDLCAIYHVRATRADTVRILGTVLLNTAVASQADDLTQAGAEHVFHTLQADTAAGWLTGLVGNMASKVAGGVADGVVNGALMYRLGRLTTRALRPLQ